MSTTPIDFAWAYHELLVDDPRQGLYEIVNIQRYQAGFSPDTSGEMWGLLGALAKILGLSNASQIPDSFTFPQADVLGLTQSWFLMSIRRAFCGKASPTEIRDVLRLAYRCGRIGPRTRHLTLSAYAGAFIGQDCNGFVGN
jgi:hypothetical protein